MNSRSEKLAKNTILFAIGNLGSKLLQIFLVPFYTRVMSTAQFGTVDVLQSIVSLLLPICSLTVYEGVFRYAMEKEYDKRAVFTIGVIISAIGAGVLCCVGGAMSVFTTVEYIWIVIANTVAGFFRSLVSQYTRSIERTALFTLDNVLMTAYVLGFNIIFIVVLKQGINGYMMGYTLANALSCVFLFVVLGKDRKLNFHGVNKPLVKEMLKFSVPLIPNAVCWWLSGFIDRIIIVAQIGEAANGIYAAAHKIPSLLTVVVTIFFQAWQISANQEFKKKDIAEFYSEINQYIIALVIAVSAGLTLFCRPITSIFLGAEYQAAWQIMPLLLVAMTFFCFAQFLGSIYSANKKTSMAFVTNFIGVLVCLSLNLLLVVYFKIGILGSAIASATSYFVLWISRIISTQKIVPIKYELSKTVIATVLLLMQAVITTANIPPVFTYSVSAAITLFILFLFRNSYRSLIIFVFRFVKKILGRAK